MINLGTIDIIPILILLTHETDVSPFILAFFNFCVLYFTVYRFFNSFVRFILKYSIIFDAIVMVLIFKFQFQLFHACGNTIDFFYIALATLLNLLIKSSSFFLCVQIPMNFLLRNHINNSFSLSNLSDFLFLAWLCWLEPLIGCFSIFLFQIWYHKFCLALFSEPVAYYFTLYIFVISISLISPVLLRSNWHMVYV